MLPKWSPARPPHARLGKNITVAKQKKNDDVHVFYKNKKTCFHHKSHEKSCTTHKFPKTNIVSIIIYRKGATSSQAYSTSKKQIQVNFV